MDRHRLPRPSAASGALARARLPGGLLFALGLGACDPLDRVPILTNDACATEREEVVERGEDGDTIKVGAGGIESVRLLGINAPELEHADLGIEAECYGDESAEWMDNLLRGRTVTLRFDASCTDEYGRTLAYVYYVDDDGETQLANERSVRYGYARVFDGFENIQLYQTFVNAEDDARRAGRGLWGECEG